MDSLIEREQSFKEEKETKKNSVDEELEELLSHQRASIKVIGCGGGGCNTINRVSEVGVTGAETIGINTDTQDLLYTTADKKILIGRDLTKGLGAGGQPNVGREAAKESEQELRKALQGSDMIFITCGLGGGTGTGSAPVVAEIAKSSGALTIGVVTMPFKMEGARRLENAQIGLELLEKNVDTLIVIPNDKLLEIAKDLPLNTAFKIADEVLTNAVKGMSELVTKVGLVNLDFADVRTVMKNGGVALIGIGESDSENRAEEAVFKAINNPLLDADISGARGALINVIGGPDLKLEEARTVVEAITSKLEPESPIIWGAQINDDLEGIIRVMLVVTGVRSTQITGRNNSKFENKTEQESNLGINFID
jgi:cell division protein FtsZ